MSNRPFTWDKSGKLVPMDEARHREQMEEATAAYREQNVTLPEPKIGLSRKQRAHTAGWSFHRFLSHWFPGIKWPWVD